MLRKLTIGLLLSVAALSAQALPDGFTKEAYCTSVGNNVIAGAAAKADTKPEDLETSLFGYSVNLVSLGFTTLEVEQLVRAVQSGYSTTGDPAKLAQKAYERCLSQKEV